MAGELVERIWDGPFDAFLPDMTVLRRGDKHLVTPEQAESGHWKDPNGQTPAPAGSYGGDYTTGFAGASTTAASSTAATTTTDGAAA